MSRPSGSNTFDDVPVLLTMAEVAERLGVCERTIRGHVDRGELAHIALGRGTIRRRRMIHPDDLDAFVDLMRRGGGSAPSVAAVGRPVRQRRRPSELALPKPGDFLERLAVE